MSTRFKLDISKVLKGEDPFKSDVDHVVVLLFQVNCPGCFTHALPQVSELSARTDSSKVGFLAIATAFENFDLNTMENAEALVNEGVLVGSTAKRLGKKKLDPAELLDGLSVAVDRLIERSAEAEFEQFSVEFPELVCKAPRENILQLLGKEIEERPRIGATFQGLRAQGTPTLALVQRKTLRVLVAGIGHQVIAEITKALEELGVVKEL